MSIDINQIKEIVDIFYDQGLVLGKCRNPNCANPDKLYLAWSALDQGGATHINAMTMCPCGRDNCLLGQNTPNSVICFDCAVTCDANYDPSQDYYVCSKDVLSYCSICKVRYCGNINYYGDDCNNCIGKCSCNQN